MASACAGSGTRAAGSHAPARVVLLVDRSADAAATGDVQAAAHAVLAELASSDEVGLALVPAEASGAPNDDPLALPIAALDEALRARLLARIDEPSTATNRPLYDALAAVYTAMTDQYDASRPNLVVALVAGPNLDDSPGDDDAQLAGLVGELRVGAAGANARAVHVVAIVLGASADALASMRAVAAATGDHASAASTPVEAASAVARVLRAAGH
jgi:hypothetical protein